MSEPVIHYCNWAGQPDVGLQCGGWTTPLWDAPPSPDPDDEVHWGEPLEDEGGEPVLFTFDEKKATCPQCLKGMDK